MAAGSAARGRARRRQGVPAIRAQSQRLITGLLALLLTFAGLWYTTGAGKGLPQLPLLLVAGGGVVLLLLALILGWRPLVLVALFPLVAPQAVVLLERGPLLLAPLLGSALLAISELALWSIGARAGGRHERRLRWALAVRLLTASLAGAALGYLVLAISGLKATGGLDLTIIGAAAVVATLSAVTWMVRAALRGGKESEDRVVSR